MLLLCTEHALLHYVILPKHPTESERDEGLKTGEMQRRASAESTLSMGFVEGRSEAPDRMPARAHNA